MRFFIFHHFSLFIAWLFFIVYFSSFKLFYRQIILKMAVILLSMANFNILLKYRIENE